MTGLIKRLRREHDRWRIGATQSETNSLWARAANAIEYLQLQIDSLRTKNAQLRKSLAEYEDFARTVTGDKP